MLLLWACSATDIDDWCRRLRLSDVTTENLHSPRKKGSQGHRCQEWYIMEAIHGHTTEKRSRGQSHCRQQSNLAGNVLGLRLLNCDVKAVGLKNCLGFLSSRGGTAI